MLYHSNVSFAVLLCFRLLYLSGTKYNVIYLLQNMDAKNQNFSTFYLQCKNREIIDFSRLGETEEVRKIWHGKHSWSLCLGNGKQEGSGNGIINPTINTSVAYRVFQCLRNNNNAASVVHLVAEIWRVTYVIIARSMQQIFWRVSSIKPGVFKIRTNGANSIAYLK